MTDDALFKLVPTRDENAVSVRLIWEIERVWTPGSIKARLEQLVKKELIKRKPVEHGKKFKWLYFRKRARRPDETPD